MIDSCDQHVFRRCGARSHGPHRCSRPQCSQMNSASRRSVSVLISGKRGTGGIDDGLQEMPTWARHDTAPHLRPVGTPPAGLLASSIRLSLQTEDVEISRVSRSSCVMAHPANLLSSSMISDSPSRLRHIERNPMAALDIERNPMPRRDRESPWLSSSLKPHHSK